jgi:hypothetical protein
MNGKGGCRVSNFCVIDEGREELMGSCYSHLPFLRGFQDLWDI